MTAPIGLASTVPAALESIDLEEPLLCAIIAASDQEQEICDINSNNEDYSDMNNATSSKIGGRLRSRKRVRQTKDIGDNNVEAPSTYYLDVLD